MPAPLSRLRPAVAFGGLALLLGLARPASANDPKVEAEAKKLQQDAMDIDFLGLDLKKAKDKLQKALKKCGTSKCSKPVLAALHRDLGVVLLNAGDQEAGEKEIAAAIEDDPKVSISKDYLDNGAVRKAWESAKKGKSGITDGGGAPALAEGALGVTVTMAPVGYELPIVIAIPAGLDVTSVKVSYKTDTIEKYRQLEAKKAAGKWLAILPCEITAKPTTVKFFVKAFDESSSELEHYGTIKKPAILKVVESMPDEIEAPQLPGGKDPKECAAGAGDGPVGKPDGSGCSNDDECDKGLVCVENDTGKKWCKPGDKKPKGDYPKFFIGLDFQTDLVMLGNEKDLCNQTGVWACTVDGPSGRLDVHKVDPSLDGIGADTGGGGKTDGGMAVATKRVLLTGDYFLTQELALGLRVGWAFGGNPTNYDKFVPFHAETRLHYFFANGIFRPYVMFGGGYGQFDAPVPNAIIRPQKPEEGNACIDPDTSAVAPKEPGGDCPGTTRSVLNGVTAYRRVGPTFAALGAGFWLAPTKSFVVNLGFKAVFGVPNFSTVLAPEVGVKYGF